MRKESRERSYACTAGKSRRGSLQGAMHASWERSSARKPVHMTPKALQSHGVSSFNLLNRQIKKCKCSEIYHGIAGDWYLRTHSGDPMTGLLAVESAKLREKWVVFQKNSPEEERLDLQRSEPTIE